MAHVGLLEATARRAGVRFGVLVEIELGMKRCGVAPQSRDLLDLAGAIAASDVLSFKGVQAYDGHLAGVADPAVRRRGAEKSRELTELAVGRLRSNGFQVPIVAGCSTGHMPFVRDLEVWTDIQAGSYLLMDGAYADLSDLAFEKALFGLATVIHRSPERVVLDIGLKHLAVDHGNPVWTGDPSVPLRLSDEHTAVAVSPAATLAVGDRTFVLPRHVDPTINLHPALWLLENGAVSAAPVDGRMPLRHVPA